jgi:hypothetical protein
MHTPATKYAFGVFSKKRLRLRKQSIAGLEQMKAQLIPANFRILAQLILDA